MVSLTPTINVYIVSVVIDGESWLAIHYHMHNLGVDSPSITTCTI